MNRQLKVFGIILTPLVIGLSYIPISIAGVPSSKQKWMQWNNAWGIDTEDIEMKGKRLRFYVSRAGQPGEDTVNVRQTWQGKIRISCDSMKARHEIADGKYGNHIVYNWYHLRQGLFGYDLASHFCYLTGEPGFTPEGYQSAVADKIRDTIISKYRKNIPTTYTYKKSIPKAPECNRALHDYDCSYSKYLDSNASIKAWADANPDMANKERIRLKSVD
ncbi:hypothetical protein [Prochlorococcus marinus]|uniref:hypothetical protein n=1 Tax=Prochlorococcus TaxID=1218 RepID=UPI0007B3BF8B|nr:hypothetical protein [Prochlorococcus marinus]KZR76493.1 hypothetical protein PMIT1323_01337 [Prochlorococcus marinus str. MIT 1323]